ncbi:carbohydrate-binding domain-containing protein [Chitinophaga sp. RAB17]|uniref:carbohydrate-binding domain-containing protein n=1 Tax=Chitinophaga sp. RAB17 TaxID=3233049 RepID=UPI003F929E21
MFQTSGLFLWEQTEFQVRYSSNQAASIRFSVDGTDLPVIDMPVTGNGVWSLIDAGSLAFPANSLHTVRLKIVSGSLSINFYNRVSL